MGAQQHQHRGTARRRDRRASRTRSTAAPSTASTPSTRAARCSRSRTTAWWRTAIWDLPFLKEQRDPGRLDGLRHRQLADRHAPHRHTTQPLRIGHELLPAREGGRGGRPGPEQRAADHGRSGSTRPPSRDRGVLQRRRAGRSSPAASATRRTATSTGPGLYVLDLGLFKDFKIGPTSGLRLQVQAPERHQPSELRDSGDGPHEPELRPHHAARGPVEPARQPRGGPGSEADVLAASRDLILGIDQGTTSTRSCVMDAQGRVSALSQLAASPDLPARGLGRARRGRDLGERPAAGRRDRRRRGRRLARGGASASPTRARRCSSGTATPASRWRPPSSGRTCARSRRWRRSARDAARRRHVARGHRPRLRTRTSPRPSSAGCSTTCRRRARSWPRRAGSAPARWTPGSSSS